MSPACAPPDPTLGIALRLTQYLDCQARVLGENGYLGLATGPLGQALLTTCLSILVASIGYRLILGGRPELADGVSLTMRVGIALALLGSWPAFQTVIYRVATDGPVEVANAILGPAGLPSEGLAERVQLAYDTIRLGSAVSASAPEGSSINQRFQFQGAAPKTAIVFLVETVGLLAAVRICIAFLLAIGPLAVLSILFAGGRGLFLGWVRILVGLAIGAVAATTITAVELALVESELARLQAFRTSATAELVDPQALSAIVLIGLMMAGVALFAAIRVASRIELRFAGSFSPQSARQPSSTVSDSVPLLASTASVSIDSRSSRERAIAQSLLLTTRREQSVALVRGFKLISADPSARDSEPSHVNMVPGLSRRRGTICRTRTAMRREMLQ